MILIRDPIFYEYFNKGIRLDWSLIHDYIHLGISRSEKSSKQSGQQNLNCAICILYIRKYVKVQLKTFLTYNNN